MSAPFSGKCLCGGVRLNISSAPVAVIACFCEHCNKGSGGTHQLIAKVATSDVKVQAEDGIMGSYNLTDTGSGLPKEKVFCRTCGVTLWTVPNSAKGKFMMVRAPVLDGGLELQPTREIFTKHRPSWVRPTEGASQWEEMPEG